MAQYSGNSQHRAQLPNLIIPIIQPSLALGDNSIQSVMFAPSQTSLNLPAPSIDRPMLPVAGNQQPGVLLAPVNQTGGKLQVTPHLRTVNATSNTTPMQSYPLLFAVPGVQVPPSQTTHHGYEQTIQSSAKDDIPNCGRSDMSVQEKYQLWHQYKTLLKKNNFSSLNIDAFACFLIRAMRSITRHFPKREFSDYITLALKEWKRTSMCDLKMFFKVTKELKQIERNDKMKSKSTKSLHMEDNKIKITDPDMMKYVDTLCDNPHFLSKAETFISPDFIDMILSPNVTLDLECLTAKLEIKKIYC